MTVPFALRTPSKSASSLINDGACRQGRTGAAEPVRDASTQLTSVAIVMTADVFTIDTVLAGVRCVEEWNMEYPWAW